MTVELPTTHEKKATEEETSPKVKLVWKGTWVGSDSCSLPSDEEFKQSLNTFELAAEGGGGVGFVATELGLDTIEAYHFGGTDSTVSWTGSYLLDNGEGLEKTSDLEHKCVFNFTDFGGDSSECVTTATAMGDTDFGRFISFGRMYDRQTDSKTNGVRLELVLARRYLAPKDPRLKISLTQIENVGCRVLCDVDLLDVPWQSLEYKPKPPKKKTKSNK